VGLREFLKPRPDRFLQSLITQAAITYQGVTALQAYVAERSDERAAANVIHNIVVKIT
jgi:hypothetical protein